MRIKKCGLGVFVKTVGLSDVKTRLAKDLGKDTAENIYLLSVKALEQTLIDARKTNLVDTFWAVAESEASDYQIWNEFPLIIKTELDLGKKLFQVYDFLLAKYEFAMVIGSDSPQISTDLLVKSIKVLSQQSFNGPSFVAGPSRDGGFYLFGGNVSIPEKIWTSITYSTSTTYLELEKALYQAKLGQIHQLETLSDIDTVEDLTSMFDELSNLIAPNFEQLRLKAEITILKDRLTCLVGHGR